MPRNGGFKTDAEQHKENSKKERALRKKQGFLPKLKRASKAKRVVRGAAKAAISLSPLGVEQGIRKLFKKKT